MAEVKANILSFEKDEKQEASKINDVPIEKVIPALSEKTEEVLVIDEKLLKNVEYKLSKCCNPIFGDEIFGFVTINEGIKIHRLHCPNANEMIKRYGYRVVKARWAETDSNTYFQAAIKLTAADEIGILSKISDIIEKDLRVNLRSINVETNEGMFEGMIKLFVKDVRHLDVLTHRLLKIKGVLNAIRIDAV
jgi:GTP diphosphokinase / guanosine-3',5'-bis(diphosphate) 3'-diphosphatase